MSVKRNPNLFIPRIPKQQSWTSGGGIRCTWRLCCCQFRRRLYLYLGPRDQTAWFTRAARDKAVTREARACQLPKIRSVEGQSAEIASRDWRECQRVHLVKMRIHAYVSVTTSKSGTRLDEQVTSTRVRVYRMRIEIGERCPKQVFICIVSMPLYFDKYDRRNIEIAKPCLNGRLSSLLSLNYSVMTSARFYFWGSRKST